MSQLLALILPALFSACGGNFHILNSTATPTFIQANGANVPSSTSISVTLTAPALASSLFVVAIETGSSALTSVQDTLGNTYQTAQPMLSSAGIFTHLYYALNSTVGPNTVTATFGTSSTQKIIIAEYSHASALAGGGQQTGTSNASSANVPVTAGNALIVGAVMGAVNLTFSNGPLMTIRATTSTMAFGDGFIPTAAIYVPTINLAAADSWIFQSAAFK